MQYYGIELAYGTDIANLTCESGSSFPSTQSTAGRLFYHTASGLNVYNGTSWLPVGGTTSSVSSINGRTGNVVLQSSDFEGLINSTNLPVATQSILGGIIVGSGLTITNSGVLSVVAGGGGPLGVLPWSSITNTPTTLTGYGITDGAPINNPVFTGNPTAPAPTTAQSIATKAYVDNAVTGAVNPLITKISRAYFSFLALTDDGRIFSWGYNHYQSMGRGCSVDTNYLANPVPFPSSEIGHRVTDLVCNSQSIYALFDNGNLYAWGYNGEGQLGLGDLTTRDIPTLSATNVERIYSFPDSRNFEYTSSTSMYIKKRDGTFWCTGNNAHGELALGHITDQRSWIEMIPPEGKTISTIWPSACGSWTCFCKTTDNQIYATGYNNYGQLGIGNTAVQHSWVNVSFFNSIPDVEDIQCSGVVVTTAASGAWSTVVRTASGNVYTAGYNAHGQLGIGTTVNSTAFNQVDLGGKVATKVIKTTLSVWVIFSDGTYSRWGYNVHGSLGIGTTVNAKLPVSGGADTVSNIFASTATAEYSYIQSTYLLKPSGLYFCGYNDAGIAGIGSTTVNVAISTPVQVPINNLNIRDIIISGNYSNTTTALMSFNDSHQLYGCGYNGHWELNTTSSFQRTFVPLNIETGV